jgi:hypothetical protein
MVASDDMVMVRGNINIKPRGDAKKTKRATKQSGTSVPSDATHITKQTIKSGPDLVCNKLTSTQPTLTDPQNPCILPNVPIKTTLHGKIYIIFSRKFTFYPRILVQVYFWY